MPTVDGTGNLLPFHFFFTRKLFFVKEADALVLCPGGFGTLDEALEVLTLIQTGKSPLVPVVLLDAPGGTFWQGAMDFIRQQLGENHYILPTDMQLMRLVYSVEEAVEQINQFYSNFHSSRWLKKQFVIRMHHKLNDQALEHMQEAFADLCLSDRFSSTRLQRRRTRRRTVQPSDATGIRVQWPQSRAFTRTGGLHQSAGKLG
jgi:hypothetical protein